MLRIFMVAALAQGLSTTYGQWGIRFSPLHIESVTRKVGLNLLVGVDHDLNYRTGIGLDFTYYFDAFADLSDSEEGGTSTMVVNYNIKQRCLGITYRSQYFFSDNDLGAFYIGPFIGVRKSDFEVDPYFAYSRDGNYTNISLPTKSYTKVTFPLGMRCGVRMALSGYTQDIYVGAGYQLGSGAENGPNYLTRKDELSKFYFQVGLSFGVGWD